jgi:hypothetical protein
MKTKLPGRRAAAVRKSRRFRSTKTKLAGGGYASKATAKRRAFSVARRASWVLEEDLDAGVIRHLLDAIKDTEAQSREKRQRLELDFKLRIDPEAGAKVVSQEAFALPEAPPKTPTNAPLDRALGKARDRGRVLLGEILSRPEMLTTHEFGERLGLSRPTVLQRLEAHEVLGLQGAKRGFRFPEWQLDRDGKPFSALPRLLKVLGDEWTVYRFLVQHHPELGHSTGIEALRSGHSDRVIDTAETIAHSAFS